MNGITLICLAAIVAAGAAAPPVVEEMIVPTSVQKREAAEGSKGSGFSLEEFMLLLDAAEKQQNKGNEDEGESGGQSSFQRRLKQIVKTARVAAGSGQSTGSDFLDQSIRQVRARVNANGGSVSDASIFDAVVQQIGNGGATPSANAPDEGFLSNVIASLSPQQATTTPAPNNSFLGGLLRQITSKDPNTGESPSILDAVVKQLVSTTTTTTTTTPAPPPNPLQILDGLIKAYQSKGGVEQRSGGESPAPTADGATPQAQPSNAIVDGFKKFLTQIQSSSGQAGGDQGGAPGGPNGMEIIGGFLKQLQNIQNRGGSPAAAPGEAAPGGQSPAAGGLSSPDLSFLKDFVKEFQSKLSPGSVTTPSSGDGLEGFEGLIPDGPTTSPVVIPTTPPVTARGQPQVSSPQKPNPLQTLGGFISQLDNQAKQQGHGGLLQGLSSLFKKNQQA